MTIDLTKKDTVATWVNTMVVEAGTYLGHSQNVQCTCDATLRPYSRNLMPLVFAAISNVAPFFAPKAKDPEEKGEKEKSKTHYFLGPIFTVVSAFFCGFQADSAKKALNQSQEYDGAALAFKWGHHRELLKVDNSIAKTSNYLWNLTQKVKAIDELRSSEAASYLHCIYGATIGSLGLSTGLYAMNPLMKTGGLVILVSTAFFCAYTFFSHKGDHDKIVNYYGEIGTLGEQVRHHLQFFDDDMKAQSQPSGSYDSLFNEFKYTDQPEALTDAELKDLNYSKLTDQK